MESYDVKVCLDDTGIIRKWAVTGSRHDLYDKIRDQVTRDLRIHVNHNDEVSCYQLYLKEADLGLLIIDSSDALQKGLNDLQPSSNPNEPQKLKFVAKRLANITDGGCIRVDVQKRAVKEKSQSSTLFQNSPQKDGQNLSGCAMVPIQDVLQLRSLKLQLDQALVELSECRTRFEQLTEFCKGPGMLQTVHNEVNEVDREPLDEARSELPKETNDEPRPSSSNAIQTIATFSDETSEPNTDEVSDSGTETATEESTNDTPSNSQDSPQRNIVTSPTSKPPLTPTPNSKNVNDTTLEVADTPGIKGGDPEINWNNVLVDPEAAREMLKPFVGSKSKITLISKALARYEGFLRSVNPTSYQINLQSVRFFGSEDRPVMRKLLPKSETFPSVSFQLNELRDVRVYVDQSQDPGTGALSEQDSSPKILIAPQIPIHVSAASSVTPATAKKNDSQASLQTGSEYRVQMEGSNGEYRLRVPDLSTLSPRKSGANRSILVQIPSSMLSPQNSTTQNQSTIEEVKLPDGDANEERRVTRSRAAPRPKQKSPVRKVIQPKSKSVVSRGKRVSKEPDTETDPVSSQAIVSASMSTERKLSKSLAGKRTFLPTPNNEDETERKRSTNGRFSLKRGDLEVAAEVDAEAESTNEPKEGRAVSSQPSTSTTISTFTKRAKRARR